MSVSVEDLQTLRGQLGEELAVTGDNPVVDAVARVDKPRRRRLRRKAKPPKRAELPEPAGPIVRDGRGDRWLRRGQVASVVFVAAVAFIQSWTHIYDIASTHGQNMLDSSLLPLSVDGMIVSCSLTLARAHREGRTAPIVTRLMLWLAVAATVAANVVYGLPFQLVGVFSSAWPAVAFLGTVEGVFGGLVSTRLRRKKHDTGDDSDRDTAGDTDGVSDDATADDTRPDTERPGNSFRPPAPRNDTEAHAHRLLRRKEDRTTDELAAKTGVSKRTAQRYLDRWRGVTTDDSDQDTEPGPDDDTAARPVDATETGERVLAGASP